MTRVTKPQVIDEAAPVLPEEPIDFDAIYRLYAHTVARWAGRLGGPSLSVEDAVQDVFAVVSRKLPSFRGEAKLSTWLFAITDQTVKNWIRRQKWRRLFSALTRTMEESVPAPQLTVLEELERRESKIAFYRILHALPVRERQVLVLFEVEGLSTQEIAVLLNVRVETVRVQVHRARKAFLKRLENDQNQPGGRR